MAVRILEGDCREVLRTLPDASVHSIVTDPPYHLTAGKKGGTGEASVNLESPYGRARVTTGFMGMTWDGGDVAFRAETWAECLRVLKPGGHLLAFGGSRTYHRLACAVEDAGFEIRDQIMWLYGSGFPKSLNVSKAIDQAGGASPIEQASMLRQRREAAGLTREQVAEAVGCTVSSVRDWEEGRARAVGAPIEFIVPSKDYRAKLADLLGYSADERQLIGASTDRRGDGTVYGVGHSGEIRAGGFTDAARQWQGWGTALKPAHEPIVVARKPLSGTVAANVLAHGTGALNIDGCRVDSGGTHGSAKSAGSGSGRPSQSGVPFVGGIVSAPHEGGRWPANVIHDGSDEVLAAFPDDSGTAARFFYCAKASKADREVGCDGLPTKRGGMVSNTSGQRITRRDGGDPGERANHHPTVKPTELMRWLVRLVTPRGGCVLDPFAGSGSTGRAAAIEGFDAILIEMNPEYAAIARRRIAGDAPLLAEVAQG